MGLQRFFIIAGFALFFIAVQLVTLYGCYNTFRSFKKNPPRIAALIYILFLNLSYPFLFYRYPLSTWLKTIINHILIYPYFIYMLLCLVLFPWFVLSGLFVSAKKLRAKFAALIGYDDTKTKRTVPEGRRDFLKVVTSALLLPVGGCSLYGTYIGRNKITIEEQTLSFPDLPEALDGLSIVQISDLHAGVFMEGWELEPYIEIVNDLKPDIVVITGDIISWGAHYIEPAVAALGKIKCNRGVYAIMGNHDFYGDTEELCTNLEKAGITVLRNQWEKIGVSNGASPLYLIGVDDVWATRHFKKRNISLRDIISGIPERSFKLLLSHNPTLFDEAAAHGIQLTLSGHTHAGQIIFPFPQEHGYSFARLIYKRDYGLYRTGDSFLYINRGLGVIGPPLRINCPREITRIIFKKQQA
jgi:predicted MPP superfamily phosphohydrolase